MKGERWGLGVGVWGWEQHLVAQVKEDVHLAALHPLLEGDLAKGGW